MRTFALIAGTIIAQLLLFGCSSKAVPSKEGNQMPTIKADFESPEGAILRLEDAYRAKDIKAAIQCKDFMIEARLMFEKLKGQKSDKNDADLISKTAEVLELAFRKEIEKNGFPDMKGISSTFPTRENFEKDIVIVTEVCKYPDGGNSKQRILVAKTDKGWRVLNTVE
jgi:hypothetical protein